MTKKQPYPHGKGMPGDPEFDAEMRRRWLINLREVMPASVTDEQFELFVAEIDKIRDQFVADLAAAKQSGSAS